MMHLSLKYKEKDTSWLLKEPCRRDPRWLQKAELCPSSEHSGKCISVFMGNPVPIAEQAQKLVSKATIYSSLEESPP